MGDADDDDVLGQCSRPDARWWMLEAMSVEREHAWVTGCTLLYLRK